MINEYSAGIVTYYIDTQKRKKVEYLLLRYAAGHWDFPKGNIEEGETAPEAALRELQEEAGITAELDTCFQQPISYRYKNKQGQLVSKKVLFFIGRADDIKVTLSDEHTDYRWLPFNDALKLLTYSNAQQVLTIAHQCIEKDAIMRAPTS